MNRVLVTLLLSSALCACAPALETENTGADTSGALGAAPAADQVGLPFDQDFSLTSGSPSFSLSFDVDRTAVTYAGDVRINIGAASANPDDVQSQADDLVGGVKIPLGRATLKRPDGTTSTIKLTALPIDTTAGTLRVYFDDSLELVAGHAPGRYHFVFDISSGFFSDLSGAAYGELR